jgi:hypothetical protein
MTDPPAIVALEDLAAELDEQADKLEATERNRISA